MIDLRDKHIDRFQSHNEKDAEDNMGIDCLGQALADKP
jgi:hypothetical protein